MQHVLLRAPAEVTAPVHFPPVPVMEQSRNAHRAEAIDREYDLPEVVRVTDQADHRAGATGPGDHLESVTRTDPLPSHRSHVRRDNVRQVGVPQAIVRQGGDHRCTVRPSLARPSGIHGIDRAIVHRDTGGDRSRQQP